MFRGELAKVRAKLEPWEKQLIEHNGKLEVTSTKGKFLNEKVEDRNASLDALQRVGSELAMHVVAAKPLFLSKDLVSSDAIENEHEILKSKSRCSSDFSASGVLPVVGRLLLQ
ncbi:unnamed protein product [Ilex paraguariensis]|uniref:Translation elongation factor EFTs/EF1B dimerisation domain-containing protein n=1 Tax=Ilex paraguariensis TaxID=185542 RepID=A0ABC8SPP2_9AQUA